MDTNFVLVEETDPLQLVSKIQSLFRVYTSKIRAESDLELIRSIEPGRVFTIIEVPFVD